MATSANILPDRYRGPVQIGEGGMGEIFRATDDTLGRAVAVKVLAERYASDEAIRQRFTREALAAARLSGEPHMVTIYDVGEWNERPFIVMEYLGGGSLADRIRATGRIPTGQALTWLRQAAEALDAAHRHGVVHRDVKPGNLLLDREGAVHVADFGVASAAGLDSLTLTGTVLGTAGYLSPEQAMGERATPASDRYGLAVVAWELLAGERPFASDSMTAEAAAHVNAEVPLISEVEPSLPAELDPVFRRALAKEPEERYESAAELVADIRHALDAAAGKTSVIPPAASPPTRHRSRRVRWAVPLGALALAGAGGAIAGIVIATDDGGAPTARTVRHTVTGQDRTVTVVTTAAATTATTPPVSGTGHSLNDRGYALMQRGDYAAALPLLQSAVQKLAGTGPGDPYEGYANYNLGYTLLGLGRCDEAIPYLEKRDRLGRGNGDVARALVRAHRCSSTR